MATHVTKPSTIAPKPWRLEPAETGMPQGAEAVAAKLSAGARPSSDVAFKLRWAERTLGAVFTEARG